MTDPVLAAAEAATDGASCWTAIEHVEKQLVSECGSKAGRRCSADPFHGGRRCRKGDPGTALRRTGRASGGHYFPRLRSIRDEWTAARELPV